MKPWERYGGGSVVRWSGELWVVASSTPRGLHLIAINHNRVSASPTEDWPKETKVQVENPETGAEEYVTQPCTNGIETVEFVAPCVANYIRQSLMKTLFPDLPVNNIG